MEKMSLKAEGKEMRKKQGGDALAFPVQDAEDYVLKMLQRSSIPGLLPCLIRSVDRKKQICFEPGGRGSLRDHLERGRIGKKELTGLTEAAAGILRQLADHLLPEDGLLLDPEYIFRDGEGCYRFCYCPGTGTDLRRGVLALTEFLLPRLDASEREGVFFGYSLCQRAAETGGSPEIFRQFQRSAEQAARGEGGQEELLPAAEEASCAGTGAFPERLWERADVPAGDPRERAELLDAFFEAEEEPEQIRLMPWQQRILVACGSAIAGSFIAGAIFRQMFIGAGCTLIAAALGSIIWMRLSRKQ